MNDRTPILIVNLFADVVKATSLAITQSIGETIGYHHGSSINILKQLQQMNEGITTKKRFPLIALFQPFDETMGGNGYYTQLKVSKIVIAMLSNLADDAPVRYKKTFIPTLYPIYYEFLNQIALNGYFVVNDPGLIRHTKRDNPGSPPPPPKDAAGFNEYVDAIEIYNLELTVNTQINC